MENKHCMYVQGGVVSFREFYYKVQGIFSSLGPARSSVARTAAHASQREVSKYFLTDVQKTYSGRSD